MNEMLREAAEWRLLSLLFEYPAGPWRDQVSGLAADIDDPELKAAAQAALNQAYEGLYHTLFGPGGPVPAREVTYLGGVQFGYLLAELSAYYEAFGYRPRTDESADHIAVEAGFVAYLKLKQAYAESRADSEAAAITAGACRRFIEDHLSSLAQPLASALENAGPPYLAAAARLLAARTGPPRRAPLTVVAAEECEAGCEPAETLAEY